MTTRSKFLFDDDFGAPAKGQGAEARLPLSEMQEAVRQADEVAFLRGVAEGRRQAEADEAARLAGALQRLAMHFTEASGQFAEVAGRAERQAANLAVMMAKKLAGTLVARQPLVEIETVARAVFAHLRATPHAVVRVNAELVDVVKPRLDQIARESGFAGTIVVLGEPDMMPGDARVEWADGGTTRDSGALEAVLDEAVGRFLGATRREETR